MANADPIVRSLLIPVEGGKLLVPGAVVAEVASFQAPEKIEENSCDWLQGIVAWRGQRIPLLLVERILALATTSNNELAKKRRIVVLYGLEISQTIPFYGLLTTDIPKTLILTQNSLTLVREGKKRSGIAFYVKLPEEETVCLPDLIHLEHLLRESASFLH
jgi:chemosensory pili system protein ChpC